MYMSYSMSYTWYDVMCNVGICKSKSTLRDTSYHIRRMTGWALSYCGMHVAGCALYHKVILHCDVTPRYAVASLRVTLWRHSALGCDATPRYAVTWLFTRKTPSYETYTCHNRLTAHYGQTSKCLRCGTDTETVADDGLEMTLAHNGLKLPI